MKKKKTLLIKTDKKELKHMKQLTFNNLSGKKHMGEFSEKQYIL